MIKRLPEYDERVGTPSPDDAINKVNECVDRYNQMEQAFGMMVVAVQKLTEDTEQSIRHKR